MVKINVQKELLAYLYPADLPLRNTFSWLKLVLLRKQIRATRLNLSACPFGFFFVLHISVPA